MCTPPSNGHSDHTHTHHGFRTTKRPQASASPSKRYKATTSGQAHAHPGSSLAQPLRIAIVGKGGAGKTTIAGALARELAQRGLRVLAIDADPDANLASVLPLDDGRRPEPLARQRALLREVAGQQDIPEGLLLLNPDAGTLLPKGTVTWGGGHPLVALGWGKGGGEGCYCAEHAVLRRLLSEASAADADVTLVDSEAGLEHLSRGTIAGVDIVLVVIEPGRRSVETATAVRELAATLDIGHLYPVITNYQGQDELDTVTRWLDGWAPLTAFPHDGAVRTADLEGRPPAIDGAFAEATRQLADRIIALPLKKAA